MRASFTGARGAGEGTEGDAPCRVALRLHLLYTVPRIERPFWVAEQLEAALFEGLRARFKTWLMIFRVTKRSSKYSGVTEATAD